jgi:hypothetical protein
MDWTRNEPLDLVALALCLTKAKGDYPLAAAQAKSSRVSSRVKDILSKAAVTAGDIDPASWGATLDDYRSATAAFLSALRTSSVFARVVADPASLTVPVDRRGRYVAVDAVGAEGGNGAAKAVSAISLGIGDTTTFLASAIVVVSDEVLRTGDSAEQVMRRSLNNAVSRSLDTPFLAYLMNQSASPITASTPLPTLKEAISQMALHEGSRLMLVGSPRVIGQLAFYPASSGSNERAFPELNPNGGAIGDMIVMASDALPTGSPSNSPDDGNAVLFDVSQLIVGNDPINLSVSGQALAELDDTPVGTSDSSMTSFWQHDLIGLRAESKICYFARPGAAVEISGINW